MPRIILTAGAVRGLERCRQFLASKAPQAARRAAAAIDVQFQLLQQQPDMGRPYALEPDLRGLVIEFGASGYVALYRHDPAQGVVLILAFRHQKEAGYGSVDSSL